MMTSNVKKTSIGQGVAHMMLLTNMNLKRAKVKRIYRGAISKEAEAEESHLLKIG